MSKDGLKWYMGGEEVAAPPPPQRTDRYYIAFDLGLRDECYACGVRMTESGKMIITDFRKIQ